MKPALVTAEAPAPEPEAGPHLWTQAEAAKAMRMSVRYLRDSDCPRVELPAHSRQRKQSDRPMVRYDPEICRAWWRKHLNRQLSPEAAA